MLKIYTKRSFEFRNPKTGERIQTAFMGFTTVPDWAREDPMFKTGSKTGSISIIQTAEQQKAAENGQDPDTELTELRARGAELGIPRIAKLGKEKLKAAIAEAEEKAKGNSSPEGDQLSGMDADALRKFAESNNIDISGVAADASADDLRTAIAAAKE